MLNGVRAHDQHQPDRRRASRAGIKGKIGIAAGCIGIACANRVDLKANTGTAPTLRERWGSTEPR